jgi:hypothetical protein
MASNKELIEQVEQESVLATQEGLVELGRVLHEKEQIKVAFEKIYNKLYEEFTDLIDFSIDDINPEFNIQHYLTTITSKNNLVVFSADSNVYNNVYKLYILNEMTKYKLELQENINLEQLDEINDINEQSEEYLEQIDALETENNNKVQELTLRIINLRQKCMAKNTLIFWQRIALFVLTYIAIVSLPTAFDQVIMIVYNLFLIISLLFSCIFNVFNSLYNFLAFYNFLPILIGMSIGSLGIFYFNQSRITVSK